MFLTARDRNGVVIDEAEFAFDDLKIDGDRVLAITCRDAGDNVWVLQPADDGDYIIDSSTAGAYHGMVVEVQFAYSEEEHEEILKCSDKDVFAHFVF